MNINKNIIYLRIIFIITFLFILFKFITVTNYYYAGYLELAKYQTDVIIDNPMPRGEIYDINNNLVVGNIQTKNLIYMSPEGIDNDYEWEIADLLAENIGEKKITYKFQEVDYLDIIIHDNYSEIMQRVSQKYENKALKEENIDEALRDAVEERDLNKLKKEHTLEAIKIKILMNNSSPNNYKLIASDLSTEEQYFIKTNYDVLGGTFLIDHWERKYPYKDTMKSFLGTVGDIPLEEKQKYENLGYGSSDQVGTSYIEQEQEQYLRSASQKMQIFFDKQGNISDYKILDEGEVGKDIKLTIDINLQQDVEKILKDNLNKDTYKYFKTNYASIMDVDTGNILAISSKYIDNKKKISYDNSIGNFSTAYEVGSVIKPVILLTGYKEGVWDYKQVVNDVPMDIGGGIIKGSYHNYGLVDEYTAIGHSSNVYFYTMALKIAGVEYGKEPLPQSIDKKFFTILRDNFSQFGLGAKTGIGFSEVEGIKANSNGVGLYMDMANGQFDTYTPLQVTQYISTLANMESRYKANYLYSINDAGELDQIGKEIIRVNPIILNHLDYDEKDLKHVKETLIKPSQSSGTYYGTTAYIADPRYQFASKSGTSESFYYEEGMKEPIKTNNTSFMAYAPYEKPNIALSVLMPYWTEAGNTYKDDATYIGGQILDACYDAGYI